MKKGYPSWRYHKSEEAKIIHSEDQEHPEWKDSPAHFEEKEELAEKSIEESKDEEAPVKSEKNKKVKGK